MSVSKFSARSLALSGVIAALYAALSLVSTAMGLGFGTVQLRLSEALCVLPILFPEAVPGLAVGCLVTNLLSPYGAADLIFGTLATLLAAVLTRRIRKRALAPPSSATPSSWGRCWATWAPRRAASSGRSSPSTPSPWAWARRW